MSFSNLLGHHHARHRKHSSGASSKDADAPAIEPVQLEHSPKSLVGVGCLKRLWPWGSVNPPVAATTHRQHAAEHTGHSSSCGSSTSSGEDAGSLADGPLPHVTGTHRRGSHGSHMMQGQPSVFDIRVDGVTRDGGVHVNYSSTLSAEQQAQIEQETEAAADAAVAEDAAAADAQAADEERPPVPPLCIVIMVVGTRGDVQPFVALGLRLKEYGHRVRLASHEDFREFITGFGLEYYPLGGDPKVLSDFIVENRGIIPHSMKSASENLRQVDLIVSTAFDAATAPDPKGDGAAFKAQAIIANPPVYAHLHVAEKLGVPCHIFFTMPYSPTRAFPSPLVRFEPSADPGAFLGMRNYLSYWAVDDLIYVGVRRPLRKLRKRLELPPLRAVEGTNASHLIEFHKVPFGYCWSGALVPRPADWGPHIDVCGYFSLQESRLTSYQPPPDLAAFLAAGPPPVYIGFGSLLVDNPAGLTDLILAAAVRTGQRVLLSSGWGKLGEGAELPECVFLLKAAPHDWLLPRCSAAVHHGGAGTTAASLSAGCPTTVIYFFGDQPFWGCACQRRGVGPAPIAVDSLTEEKLVAALDFMTRPEVKAAAQEVAKQLATEDGAARGVEVFHKHLPVETLRGKKVVWNLADPPQRAPTRKALAKFANVSIRAPTRAGIFGAQYVAVKGYEAVSAATQGLQALMSMPGRAISSMGAPPKQLLHGASDDDSELDPEDIGEVAAAAVVEPTTGTAVAAAVAPLDRSASAKQAAEHLVLAAQQLQPLARGGSGGLTMRRAQPQEALPQTPAASAPSGAAGEAAAEAAAAAAAAGLSDAAKAAAVSAADVRAGGGGGGGEAAAGKAAVRHKRCRSRMPIAYRVLNWRAPEAASESAASHGQAPAAPPLEQH